MYRMNKESLEVGTFVQVKKVSINGTSNKPRKKKISDMAWRSYQLTRLLRVRSALSADGYYYYYKWLRFSPSSIIFLYP